MVARQIFAFRSHYAARAWTPLSTGANGTAHQAKASSFARLPARACIARAPSQCSTRACRPPRRHAHTSAHSDLQMQTIKAGAGAAQGPDSCQSGVCHCPLISNSSCTGPASSICVRNGSSGALPGVILNKHMLWVLWTLPRSSQLTYSVVYNHQTSAMCACKDIPAKEAYPGSFHCQNQLLKV